MSNIESPQVNNTDSQTQESARLSLPKRAAKFFLEKHKAGSFMASVWIVPLNMALHSNSIQDVFVNSAMAIGAGFLAGEFTVDRGRRKRE